MFRKAIVHFLILFLIVGFVGFIGCDDDGDEGAPPPTPTEPTPPAPTPQTLAQANNVVVPMGGGVIDVTFTVDSEVVIQGTVTWTSPPGGLSAGFMQDGTQKTGVLGGSPLTTTYTVTAAEVAAGPNWSLRVWNYSATDDATVNVIVQTVP